MKLQDVIESVFEGKKILEEHFLHSKQINAESLFYIQPEDFENGISSINIDTKYLKKQTYQKYYGQYSKIDTLLEGDILFDKTSYKIHEIKEQYSHVAIPSDRFLVVRPKPYLRHFLKDTNGKKYFIEELTKIYKNDFSEKIESVNKIYIPDDISKISDILYERPDKRRIDDIKQINIRQGLMTLSTIIKRLQYEEIHLEKYFQRHSNLWKDDVKSRFIEALIVRQPVPAFYFDATNENKWLVVDGLQRLGTVKEYVIDKTLVLKGLYYLPDSDFENKKFDQLPRWAQRNIEEYEVMAYTILPPTPKEVKYKIFRAVNESPLTLTNQEIRHALNHKINDDDLSSPAEYIVELANIEIFKNIVRSNKIDETRMDDGELALRYVAFRIIPYENYSPTMTEFLDEAMTKIYRVAKEDLDKYKIDFIAALDTINTIFGENAFKKSMLGLSETKEVLINNLFETWIHAFAIISEEQRKLLIQRNLIVIRETKALIKNEKYRNAIETENAYTKENLKFRFLTVKNLILKLVK